MGWQELFSSVLTCAIFLGLPVMSTRVASRVCFNIGRSNDSIYDFTLPDLLETRNVSLSEYRDKILLVVNVATYCGFTWHYHQLNALANSYNSSDFAVLGFPCNQFGKQEPGGNGLEILNGVKYVRPGNGFVPNFMIFKKIDVNGDDEHPLYTFLKHHCPPTRETFSSQTKLFYTPMKVQDIRWNFEKILMNRQGKPIMRYDSSTPPNEIAKDIEYMLAQD